MTVWTGCGPPLVPLQQRRWDSDRPPGEQQILGFIRDKGDDQGGAEASGARRSLKRDLGGVLPVPHGECPPTPPYASVALHPHPHRVCWVYVFGGWGVSSLPAVALKPVNPVSQASRACGWGVGGSRRNAGYCSRLRAHACVGPAIAEQAPSRRRRFAADRLPQTPPRLGVVSSRPDAHAHSWACSPPAAQNLDEASRPIGAGWCAQCVHSMTSSRS